MKISAQDPRKLHIIEIQFNMGDNRMASFTWHLPQWLSMISKRVSLVSLSDVGAQTTSQPLPFDPVPIPRFEYTGEKRLVAEGCQGRVYRARGYAIKISKTSMQREINLLARLKHPNICQLIAVGDNSALLEWVDTTARTIDWSNRKRLGFVRELAGVLDYLHTRAIDKCIVLHRDLKPDNYGVKNGHLKLLDFGLAVCLERGTLNDKYRLTGNTGSIRYMAPEVGRDEDYGAGADVYSFAITAWEILKRDKPYAGFDVKTHSRLVLHGDHRPKIPKQWQPELASILQRAWHSDPAKRPDFATILAVLESLDPDPLGSCCCGRL